MAKTHQETTALGFDIAVTPTAPQAQEKGASRSVWLTGVEIADWLAMTPAAVTQMKQAGVLIAREDGRYDARANIRSYVGKLRSRKTGAQSAHQDLNKELLRLKVANEERRNLEWRMMYGTAIAEQIREQLIAQVSLLRETLAVKGVTPADFAPLFGALGQIDIDRALEGAEGETDELADLYNKS